MKYELNLSYVVKKTLDSLNMSESDFALQLGVSTKQVYDYIFKHDNPRKSVADTIIKILEINDLNIYDLFDIPDDRDYLYHGSKTGGIVGIISTRRNSENIDFGNGFYLSNSFMTAISYVISKPNPVIYRFDKKRLLASSDIYSFYDNPIDWVLFIGLNRRKITDENDRTFFSNIYDKKFKSFDILMGEIADSYNFDVMDSFFKNESDIIQVKKALTLANIGPQYVIKNEALANALEILDEFVIETKLKEYLKQITRKKKETLKDQYPMFLSKQEMDVDYTFEKIKEKMVKEHEKE